MKKTVYAVLLMALALAAPAVVSAQDAAGRANPASDFRVTTSQYARGVIIERYTGSATAVVIPATIQGRPVSDIGGRAFSGNTSITSVAIPEGVTGIGGFAFAGCTRLSSVTLPSTLNEIGESAFQNCTALTSILLPAGITWIEASIFDGTGLTSFPSPWPPGLTTIEPTMFSGTKLSGTLVIPEGVTVIRRSAFDTTTITGLTLPSTIRDIDFAAFSGNRSLTTVTVPASVRSIRFGNYAFGECPNISSQSQARLKQVGYRGVF
jgi:hypothetical protein